MTSHMGLRTLNGDDDVTVPAPRLNANLIPYVDDEPLTDEELADLALSRYDDDDREEERDEVPLQAEERLGYAAGYR